MDGGGLQCRQINDAENNFPGEAREKTLAG
jgi:hypothetical protein